MVIQPHWARTPFSKVSFMASISFLLSAGEICMSIVAVLLPHKLIELIDKENQRRREKLTIWSSHVSRSPNPNCFLCLFGFMMHV